MVFLILNKFDYPNSFVFRISIAIKDFQFKLNFADFMKIFKKIINLEINLIINFKDMEVKPHHFDFKFALDQNFIEGFIFNLNIKVFIVWVFKLLIMQSNLIRLKDFINLIIIIGY